MRQQAILGAVLRSPIARSLRPEGYCQAWLQVQHKLQSVHSTDTIATENSGFTVRLAWVHSSQAGLLDSSLPHNILPERVGRWERE